MFNDKYEDFHVEKIYTLPKSTTVQNLISVLREFPQDMQVVTWNGRVSEIITIRNYCDEMDVFRETPPEEYYDVVCIR